MQHNAEAFKIGLFIEEAIRITDVRHIKVVDHSRLFADNGFCFISKYFEECLEVEGIYHIRSKPYHPMAQEKIEYYHRSMKDIISLGNYYFPYDLEDQMENEYRWKD